MYGAVRLWHPTGLTDGLASANLHFYWILTSNQLLGSVFIADENSTGSDLQKMTDTTPPAGTPTGLSFASIQVFNNLRALPSTAPANTFSIFGVTLDVGNDYDSSASRLGVINHSLFLGNTNNKLVTARS